MKNSIQNPEKGIALYYQVENSIREKIENGEWKVGQKLPTEPELCQFSASAAQPSVRQSTVLSLPVYWQKNRAPVHTLPKPQQPETT